MTKPTKTTSKTNVEQLLAAIDSYVSSARCLFPPDYPYLAPEDGVDVFTPRLKTMMLFPALGETDLGALVGLAVARASLVGIFNADRTGVSVQEQAKVEPAIRTMEHLFGNL